MGVYAKPQRVTGQTPAGQNPSTVKSPIKIPLGHTPPGQNLPGQYRTCEMYRVITLSPLCVRVISLQVSVRYLTSPGPGY